MHRFGGGLTMSKETREAKEIELFERLLGHDWLTLGQRIGIRREIVWRKARLVRVRMASLASKSGGGEAI